MTPVPRGRRRCALPDHAHSVGAAGVASAAPPGGGVTGCQYAGGSAASPGGGVTSRHSAGIVTELHAGAEHPVQLFQFACVAGELSPGAHHGGADPRVVGGLVYDSLTVLRLLFHGLNTMVLLKYDEKLVF